MRILILLICFCFCMPALLAQNWEQKYTSAKNKNQQKEAGKYAYELALEYHYKKKDNKQALFYGQKAIDHSSAVKDFENIADSYLLVGGIYRSQSKFNEALTNYEKAARNYERSNNKKGYATAFFYAGNSNKLKGDYQNAIKLLKTALNVSREANDYNTSLESAKDLADSYSRIGDNANARLYRELYQAMYAPTTQVTQIQEKEDDILKDSLQMTFSELEKNKQIVAQLEKQKLETQSQIDAILRNNEEQADSLIAITARATELEEKRELERQRFYIAGIAAAGIILLSIIFIIIQSRTVSAKKKANKQLEKANKELASKNEEIESQKEIIEQEKNRSEQLLLNVLPKEIADELKRNQDPEPRHYDQVTVVFTDFKGFTNVAESMSPRDLINELAECFSEFDDICERWNLERIKTIGDAYMCAGGIPTPNYTNAVDAVSAALEMQEVVEQLKQKKMLQGKPYFEMRVGVHTGALVAGIVGKKRFAYDIWGDTVNLAARMESSGEVGRVNISEYTYSLVRDYFFCSYRGKVEAKNKGQIDMYFVISKY